MYCRKPNFGDKLTLNITHCLSEMQIELSLIHLFLFGLSLAAPLEEHGLRAGAVDSLLFRSTQPSSSAASQMSPPLTVQLRLVLVFPFLVKTTIRTARDLPWRPQHPTICPAKLPHSPPCLSTPNSNPEARGNFPSCRAPCPSP